ncbi:MAG: hypothetical protein WAV20_03785 [Blastocatellia bacterium]
MISRASRSPGGVFVLAVSLALSACSGGLKEGGSTAPSSGPPMYLGYHDITDCDSIIGWAWDSNRPNDPIQVEIYDGGILVATVTADEFRQDLVAAQKGNGKHGFIYIVPPRLKDGKPHSIRVKYAGTSMDLFNTPKELNCTFQGT